MRYRSPLVFAQMGGWLVARKPSRACGVAKHVTDKRALAKPLDTSSGDILADRRADYAEMLFGSGEGRVGGRADARRAGARAPGWAVGWFRLGEFHEAAGDMEAAAEAWRMAQKLDQPDHAGAALELALAGEARRERHSPRFVETLFDQYAAKFDSRAAGRHARLAAVPEFLGRGRYRIARARRPLRAKDWTSVAAPG